MHSGFGTFWFWGLFVLDVEQNLMKTGLFVMKRNKLFDLI